MANSDVWGAARGDEGQGTAAPITFLSGVLRWSSSLYEYLIKIKIPNQKQHCVGKASQTRELYCGRAHRWVLSSLGSQRGPESTHLSTVWGSTPTRPGTELGRSTGKMREVTREGPWRKGWVTEPWREGTVFKEPKKSRKRQCVFWKRQVVQSGQRAGPCRGYGDSSRLPKTGLWEAAPAGYVRPTGEPRGLESWARVDLGFCFPVLSWDLVTSKQRWIYCKANGAWAPRLWPSLRLCEGPWNSVHVVTQEHLFQVCKSQLF